MRLGVECGQRWWRPRSWRHKPRLRRFPGGFAVGPVMLLDAGRAWMIVADDEPGVTYDLGWHFWTRRGAVREADRRNRRLRERYGDSCDVVWRLARVGDYPKEER